MTMCQTSEKRTRHAVEQSAYYVISNEASDGECLDSDEKEDEFEVRATWVIQAEGDVVHEQ